jgi:nitrite reductase (cytochrome c-552)
MENNFTQPKRKPWVYALLFTATVIIVFLLGMLVYSIVDRKSESKLYFQQVKPIEEWEPRNEIWGENFPRQFETYLQTLDTMFMSKYGGSATHDYLEAYPELVLLWAGYPFSRDYKQGRGHYHAIDDIRNTLRTGVPMPGTCWSCKSTDVPRMMNKIGIAEFYSSKWEDLGEEIINPIGCQDCHEPNTMNLRITRPALIEAFERIGKDINKATHQEMRSLVCAQCHVEYYFKGDGKYLTFPWDLGFSVDSMEKYYDNINFSDWTHSISKTPMLKGQHPDYEVFMSGVHADRGVSCADCHLPYKREGAIKYTDHFIQSPLNNISNSCLVCHRESEDKLKQNVYQRQEKIAELRRISEKSLALAHIEAGLAWEKGASESDMKEILTLIRHSQWRWDWVAASNSMGFHSPVECVRVLATSIQKSYQAHVLLTNLLNKLGLSVPVEMPDISTKEKAQAYIGLNMKSIHEDKAKFKNTVIQNWIQKADKQKAVVYKSRKIS